MCTGCTFRETQCVLQKSSNAKARSTGRGKGLREREEKLERIVDQILQRLNSKNDSGSPGESEMSAEEALKTLESELSSPRAEARGDAHHTSEACPSQIIGKSDPTPSAHRFVAGAPMLSLFDNTIVQRLEDEADEGVDHTRGDFLGTVAASHRPYFEKCNRIWKAVKALVPNDNDLSEIIRADSCCWNQWQVVFPSCPGIEVDTPDVDRVEHLRLHVRRCIDSGNTASTAKILLCIANCFQQVPSALTHLHPSLPAPPEVLQKRYMAFVQDLLAPDDGLACTIDGLQCFRLLIQLLADQGKPRKAWLLSRRAVSFAYILGLHRQPQVPQDMEATRNKALWFEIAVVDRHLSLVLGLPYTTLDHHFDPYNVEDAEVEVEAGCGWHGQRFFAKMGIIAGHIVNRNHNLDDTPFLETMKIDQELEDARNSMSPEWWDALPAPHMSTRSIRDMFVAKMIFHNNRKLLHLPFMLKSFKDRRYELSKINALESSREMIKYYQIFRSSQSLFVCNLLDFEILTASMVLVINLLSRYKSSDSFDPLQDESDWNLISSTLEMFERISVGSSYPVAKQAAEVLRQFSKARYGCDPNDFDMTYQVVIPYFGKLRIGAAECGISGSTRSMSTQMSSQMHTPAASTGEALDFQVEPLISFDGYSYQFPGDSYPWQDIGTDWSSMLDLDLQNNWSQSLDAAEAK